MSRDELLISVRRLLEDVFGERLKGVVLYGSEARGDAGEDSDIDLFVLLNGPISLWKDIYAITRTLYSLQLEVIRPIHALPVDVDAFRAGKKEIFRRVLAEGIFV